MKLFHSATSPFVRKVVACAIARDIDHQLELADTNPHSSPAGLVEANPLSKVPCLVTDDGLALFDSPVICEYLDSVGDALPLFPPSGAARWRALKQQAMGDGIMDAAVSRRGEQQRPTEDARAAAMARMAAAIARTLDQLESDPPHAIIDIGSITVACALGYLDFRYAHEPWRDGRSDLSAWYTAIRRETALARTEPKG